MNKNVNDLLLLLLGLSTYVKKNSWIFRIRINPSKKKTVKKTNLESFRCPKCGHVITVDSKFKYDMYFICPGCGQKNIFNLSKVQLKTEYNVSYTKKNLLSQINFDGLIIGLILILIGFLFLFIPDAFIIKISLTLFIIGIIFLLFINEKKQDISIKITLGLIILIILLFLVTGTDLEIFLVLIFISVLIIKIVIDSYLPVALKLRMNLFISAFFIVFVILIIKRVIYVLYI